MRNISFHATVPQMEERIKSVTRRRGWWYLTEADLTQAVLLQAIEKGQGLKKGETVKKLYPIQVLDSRREPLNRMTTDLHYGYIDVVLEGFPNMTPYEFVEFFCDMNKCLPSVKVNRMEFREWIKT